MPGTVLNALHNVHNNPMKLVLFPLQFRAEEADAQRASFPPRPPLSPQRRVVGCPSDFPHPPWAQPAAPGTQALPFPPLCSHWTHAPLQHSPDFMSTNTAESSSFGDPSNVCLPWWLLHMAPFTIPFPSAQRPLALLSEPLPSLVLLSRSRSPHLPE